VPVLDPVTGRLEGSVNITTWSASSGQLLLALAQSAASATGALMLARSRGRSARPAPRGEVFRVLAPRLEPGAGTVTALSAAWTDAVAAAEAAVRAGRLTAAVGEPGSGRATLLAQALRRAHPRDRVLDVRPPAPEDVDAWLGLWAPEAAKPATTVVLRDVDALSVATADRVRDVLAGGGGPAPRVVVTAEDLGDVAPPLARLVASVVRVAPLRERPDDVLPLAAHAARRARGREVDLTLAAARALTGHAWPGGVEQLQRVVRRAASLADRVDVGQLPPEVLTGAGRSLTRLERVERDEIVRVLTRPGTTVVGAARELGLSRATLYRRIAHLGLEVPR
jgi:sigma-54 dependent transcriptional regulator, acetoin dehydrogenase operon transcriptional activator AcoR